MTTAKHSSDYEDLKLPFSSLPEASGLYDPRFEHDACGVSFVVDVKGRPRHDIVATALSALCNLEHRGAQGAEANSGDGAGILIQVPDAFLRAKVPFKLPAQGTYGVGLCFLPADLTFAQESIVRIEAIMLDEGLRVLGWREVPVDESSVGATARRVMPSFRQIFVVDPRGATGIDLDRRLFVARKRCEHEIPELRDREHNGHLDACHLDPQQKQERREVAIHPELLGQPDAVAQSELTEGRAGNG